MSKGKINEKIDQDEREHSSEFIVGELSFKIPFKIN